MIWIRVLAFLIFYFYDLGKSFVLSELQFVHLEEGNRTLKDRWNHVNKDWRAEASKHFMKYPHDSSHPSVCDQEVVLLLKVRRKALFISREQ